MPRGGFVWAVCREVDEATYAFDVEFVISNGRFSGGFSGYHLGLDRLSEVTHARFAPTLYIILPRRNPVRGVNDRLGQLRTQEVFRRN